jgi:hypothetical protein
LLKTVANLSEQLNVVESKQVRIVCDFQNFEYFALYKKLINIEKKSAETSAIRANKKLEEVKKELRSFTSLNGFSTVLNTSNPLLKVLWMFFFLVLFSGCMPLPHRRTHRMKRSIINKTIKPIKECHLI